MDPCVFERKVRDQLFKLDLPGYEKTVALQVLCGYLPGEAYLTSKGEAIEASVNGDLIIKIALRNNQ